MSKQIKWDPSFAPSYTPEEMLRAGVFEGKYINALDGLPGYWYQIPKVLKKTDEPNPDLNKYGIKSRQPLSVWKENGWLTKHSPYGWFGWYCLYYLGRRIKEEDDWQIKRWRSFVARHQGQITASGHLKDQSKRTRQRQALLQWAWDSSLEFNDANLKKNLTKLKPKLSKGTSLTLESRLTQEW